jgi:intracellular septation protein A
VDIKTLAKNLLLGFLPLLFFIAADHFFSARFGQEQGLKYALIAAVVFGILQALFIYFKARRFDSIVLFDTGLIVALGAVSYFSGKDIFFKLKPALVEFIMVIILAIVSFVTPKLLLMMMGRFTKGMEITDIHLKMMQRTAMGMFFIFLLHTLLIVYSAFYMSREAWAFISGGLFYILAGAYFAVVFISGRIKRKRLLKQYNGDPLVELKDEKGRSMGRMPLSVLKENPRVFKRRIGSKGKKKE